MKNMRYI